MAGKKRSHYVPRFLLNRFASRSQNDTRLVWQFSKEKPPIEISTSSAAVSRDNRGVADGLQ